MAAGDVLVSSRCTGTSAPPLGAAILPPPPCQPPTWTAGWIDLTYNYVDASGHNNRNVAKITNNISHYWSQNFTYDSLNRIATAQTDGTMASGGSGNCWAETYTIDAWGNLLSNAPNPTTQSAYTGCVQESSANLTGVVQPSNRLSGSGYTTDSAGNLIADGVHAFTFDAENHLLSTAQSGQTTVTYKYDGDGKRVQKSSGTLYWYGLSSSPLMETALTGSASFAYYYFNGHITNRRPWYHVFNIDTYVLDALGSTNLVSGLNTSGAGAWDYSDYYPYGGEWAHQSAIGNHYKFTGKERDTESGLDNFGARYNDSNLGRFTSPDSAHAHLWLPQTWNRYTYALNNPLLYVDPDGADPINAQLLSAVLHFTESKSATIQARTADIIDNDKAGRPQLVSKRIAEDLNKIRGNAALPWEPESGPEIDVATKDIEQAVMEEVKNETLAQISTWLMDPTTTLAEVYSVLGQLSDDKLDDFSKKTDDYAKFGKQVPYIGTYVDKLQKFLSYRDKFNTDKEFRDEVIDFIHDEIIRKREACKNLC